MADPSASPGARGGPRPRRPVPDASRRGPPAGIVAVLVVAALLAPLGAGELAAQGFSLNEYATCAMARGGTAVADGCADGSSVAYNPAGLAEIEGFTASAGGLLVATEGSFTADLTGETTDLATDPVPAPHAFAAYGVDDRITVGLGLYVPYGLDTAWPLDFEGRFSGYDNSLRSVYVQPTAAVELTDRLSVGAGAALVLGSVELNQRLDLSRQPVPVGGLPPGTTFGDLGIPQHTGFADASLEASGATGVAGSFGVQYRVHERVRVGARYLTRTTLEYEGDAAFEPVSTGLVLPAGNPFGVPAGTPLDAVLQGAGLFASGGTLSDQGVTTEITMPDQLVAGVSVRATSRLQLLADWQWQNWSQFDRIPLRFEIAPDEIRIEDFTDTHGLRLGAEYRAGPRVTLRGGYIYHGAAAPDETVTPLLPEARRHEATAGLGWRFSPRLRVDVAYQFVGQRDRRGRVREPLPGQPPTTDLNSGVYGFAGHLFSSTLTLHLP